MRHAVDCHFSHCSSSQRVVQRASGGFTHTYSPTMIFACPCSTLSVMARGYHHSCVETVRCDIDASSWPVFGAILYQKTASWGEVWLFSVTAFMVRWCLSMIPLELGRYADLKYHLTPHFSHSSLKTSKQKPIGPLLLAPSPETHPLSLSLSLFWFFTISQLSQVHSQSWIGTIHGDNALYQWPATSNFFLYATPFFVSGRCRVNGLTLPTLLHPLLNSFHCDVWIHFPRQIKSSFLPKMGIM